MIEKMRSSSKICECGRLVVEPYPSKATFKTEETREDCSSVPAIHVSVNHDFMSTIELFNFLSTITLLSLPRRLWMRTIRQRGGQSDMLYFRKYINSLNEQRTLDWSDPSEMVNWIAPQIETWFNDVDREWFDLWIRWCRWMTRQKARYGRADGSVYNPYEGLRFQVRIEFHD